MYFILLPLATSNKHSPLVGGALRGDTEMTVWPSGVNASDSISPQARHRCVPKRAMAPGGSGSPWRSRRGSPLACADGAVGEEEAGFSATGTGRKDNPVPRPTANSTRRPRQTIFAFSTEAQPAAKARMAAEGEAS